MPILVLLVLPATVLTIVTAASAFLLLEPCAVGWSWLDRYAACRPGSQITAEARLDELTLANARIEREIYDLERELAGTQCHATGPDARRPLIPEGWQNEIASVLFGCWDVSLGYRTRDVDTDAVASYTDWQICFDMHGEGREIMRDADGVLCEGPISASFSGNGLSLAEQDNLPCSDEGYIHRREITCQLAEGGLARCATLQPETGGAAEVTISRRELR